MTAFAGADSGRQDDERVGVPADPRRRYEATAGWAQLTEIQALARLPIDQHRRDLVAGKDVATFVSGYEGSPLVGHDLEFAAGGLCWRPTTCGTYPG
jgi:indolepyruvate ferredoxin oxidoreductase